MSGFAAPIAAGTTRPYRVRTMVVASVARRLLATLPLLALLSACALPAATPPRPSSRARGSRGDQDLTNESQVLRERSRAHFEEQKRRVERVGERLLAAIPDHPKVQFVVVSGDPSINAGATFGQVAVTSGMLNFIQSDDEMAVVLGHELAHIEQGHVLKGAVGSLALNVLAIVLEARAPGAGQAAGGIGQLFMNHYTQTQEREADEVGLRFTYAAGYDPRAAVDVQERMAVEVPESMSAGYFDTHPSSVERAVAARREAAELLAQGDPPGRGEVLAQERSDEHVRAASAERRREGSGSGSRATPAAPPPDRSAATADSEDCRRAAVYAEMARDARDSGEREELRRRAQRYCPTLAEGRSGAESRGGDDDDLRAPADTY